MLSKLKKLLCFLSLLLAMQAASASIAINLTQDTTPGMRNFLVISFTAGIDYNTFPNNFWNNHVMTIRWADSLGAGAICGLTDLQGFLFAQDAGSLGSPYLCAGYYYQKLITTAFVQVNISSGQTLEVAKLQVCLPQNISCGFFELVDAPDTCVTNNFGAASINNAALGDVYCCIGMGAAACEPLQTPSPRLQAVPYAEGFIRLKAAFLGGLDWKTCAIERSEDGNYFHALKSWTHQAGNRVPQVAFDDRGIEPVKKYHYRLRLTLANGEERFTPTLKVHLNPHGSRFQVFPNPSSGEVFLQGKLPAKTPVWVEVLGMQGKKLLRVNYPAQEGWLREKLSLRSLPKGSYLIRVSEENGLLAEEFVIYY
jgi:hypothetical protein